MATTANELDVEASAMKGKKKLMRVLVIIASLGPPSGMLGAQIPDGATGGEFVSEGVSLHYWEEGRGEVLVLLHGLFGEADVWRELAPVERLSAEWRVVALDLRGHGASDKPHDPAAYGAVMADDVAALLDHLHVPRAHILGYSYGGLVAAAVLERHPDRVQSLILGGSSRIRPGTEADVSWAYALADELQGDEGAEWLARVLAGGNPDRDAAQRELIDRRMRNADVTAAAAVLRGTAELTLSDPVLQTSDAPILGLVGELDPSRTEVEAMARVSAHMRVEIIDDTDHVGAPRTARFWEAVMEWLGVLGPR